MSDINEIFEYFAKANGVTPQEALGMSFDVELWEEEMIESGHTNNNIPERQCNKGDFTFHHEIWPFCSD